jgi:hypothetical protein
MFLRIIRMQAGGDFLIRRTRECCASKSVREVRTSDETTRTVVIWYCSGIETSRVVSLAVSVQYLQDLTYVVSA